MSVSQTSPRPPLPDALRIARESLADALGLLGRHPPSDRAVHGVRKDLKRARAMLRWMRAGLGVRVYHQRNEALRDVARYLSAARDSKVLLDTLHILPPRASTSALRSRLRQERALTRSRLQAQVSSMKHVRKTLRTVRRELSAASGIRFDWCIMQNGLRRVYARGRAALARARSADAQQHPSMAPRAHQSAPRPLARASGVDRDTSVS
jgi:hypothetical protein